jgi:hypothetical protein
MCNPWKPGVSTPTPVVWILTLALVLLNSNSAIATGVPSGAFRWVVMFFCADAAGAASAPGVVADGAGDPVQIAGVVPGIVDACWGDEHALISTTQLAKDSADMVAAATLR